MTGPVDDPDETVAAAKAVAERHRRAGDRANLAASMIDLSARLKDAARYPEAIRTAHESVGIYRELEAPEELARALRNLDDLYEDAPSLRVMRVRLAAADIGLFHEALRETRTDVAGWIQSPEGEPAHAEAYVRAGDLDALRERGVAIEVIGDATAVGIVRQGEVGVGDRFAEGLLPEGAGILTGGPDDVPER